MFLNNHYYSGHFTAPQTLKSDGHCYPHFCSLWFCMIPALYHRNSRTPSFAKIGCDRQECSKNCELPQNRSLQCLTDVTVFPLESYISQCPGEFPLGTLGHLGHSLATIKIGNERYRCLIQMWPKVPATRIADWYHSSQKSQCLWPFSLL